MVEFSPIRPKQYIIQPHNLVKTLGKNNRNSSRYSHIFIRIFQVKNNTGFD